MIRRGRFVFQPLNGRHAIEWPEVIRGDATASNTQIHGWTHDTQARIRNRSSTCGYGVGGHTVGILIEAARSIDCSAVGRGRRPIRKINRIANWFSWSVRILPARYWEHLIQISLAAQMCSLTADV